METSRDAAPANLPLCTIVMATHNRPKLVGIAIKSVLEQSYPNIELCLVNDGGCDIQEIVAAFNDPRIRYFPLPVNLGPAHAYNYAIYQSRGAYIGYVADDDLLYPNHVETLIGTLEKHPEIGAAYSDQYLVTCEIENGAYTRIIEKKLVFSVDFDRSFLLSRANTIPHPCLIHRRALFAQAGKYDESLACIIDWDFFRRMAFYAMFLHVKVITGEYFFPLNKQERVSDLFRTDRARWNQCQERVLAKRPPEPWMNLKPVNLLIFCDRLDARALEQLKELYRLSLCPVQLFLAVDRLDEAAGAVLKEIRDDQINLVFNLAPIGLAETVRKCIGAYFRHDHWVMAIDGSVVVDDQWGRRFMDLLNAASAGTYRQPARFEINRLYTALPAIADI